LQCVISNGRGYDSTSRKMMEYQLHSSGPKWKFKHMRNYNWITKLKIIKTYINEKETRWKTNRMNAKIEK
jgi:hypothetical protein